MDKEYLADHKDLLEEAEELQKALGLKSIDTAILMLIHQTLDTIRFHNSD